MPELKYLFIAEFTDGTLFKQTPEDISQTVPEKNCYYDLRQEVAGGKVIRRFSVTDGKNTVTVDLGNGIFYVNGFPVLLESERLPCLPQKFELIWYHQVTQQQNVTYKKKTGDIIKKEDLPEFREYFIGWKCEISGKSYQQKLAVA